MKKLTPAMMKLVYSIITVLLLIVSLTTSTFAWFQINSIGTVSGFNFSTVTGLGFKVSIDDELYSNDLSADQMKMAILNAYNPEKYVIKTSKSEDGKKITQELEYHYTDGSVDGKPVEKVKILSSEEMSKVMSESIALLPVTSTNGIDLYDLYNSPSDISYGRFLEFSVYFKAESTNLAEGQNINIYLSGKEVEEVNGNKVAPTTITSDYLDVNLLTRMDTFKGSYEKGQHIRVSSVNALRYSVEDRTYNDVITKKNDELLKDYEARLEASKEDPTVDVTKPTYFEKKPAQIYEPTDEFDLGSYATVNYSGTTDEEKKLFDELYDANKCASFNYYNRLKPSRPLGGLDYSKKPNSIRSLVDEDGNNKALPIIANVKSGEESKKVTFRFWLEGWDADCFDGLANSINVKLSFRSEYVLDDNNR